MNRSFMLLMNVIAVAACLLAGCAEIPTADAPDYRSRAVTRVDGGLHVSTAVLSATESAELYGVGLATKGIQPVWIEVRNNDDHSYFLMSPGIDPNFYPPSEAAEAFADESSPDKRDALDKRFQDLAFHNPARPGRTTSGFVLTNLAEGMKLVQLDFVTSGSVKTFSIFSMVPGFKGDYVTSDVFRRDIYANESIVNFTDDDSFRSALEALPCCATNEKGNKDGDPLNLIIVGGLDDAFPALVRRGWSPAERKWSGAIMKMVKSALSGERYVNAPVSDLYLFGRAQDIALQKARDNVHQRNHLRLWLAPMRYHNKPVWVGQISRDIGSRLTMHTSTFTTHKIDPDVDEARSALAEDMAYSQNLVKVGLVKGVGAAPHSAPRGNLTTDPYYTDGNRRVLVFDHEPTAISEIGLFNWEVAREIRHTMQGASQ